MSHEMKSPNRYWGNQTPPKSKLEFFNAVTSPPAEDGGSVATIRMYGPIDSWGGWWGISTKDVGEVLDTLPDSVTQIILRINSPGGEVFEGVSILNMLRAHKAKVTAVVDGRAASAASFIAAGCDETVMSPGTQMMIHSPLVITYGNAAELRKTAEVLDGIEDSIIEIYAAKAGEKDWAQLLADETWMTAAETVEQGLADRVAVVPDAGETSTVGEDDDPLVVVVPDEDADDSIPMRLATSARLASKLPVSTEPGDPNQKEKLNMSDTIKAGLRERLGVTDAEATDEELLAALDEALDEQADDTPAASAAPKLPEGAVVMDAAVLAELREQAALGVQAREEQVSDRRDAVVASAVASGRIASSTRDTWRAALDKDEQGITALLDGMPANTALPVKELGHADGVTSADDALYAAAWGETTKEA
ncbi:head maturation protease, ClpP-related [Microbacterium sp. NPDC058389]|uniref:head maturation protease, ClpP-related n=1 Tax=Microbacterium sp. NPDC058389 TaxID=3346475 RepID=UPI00365A751A